MEDQVCPKCRTTKYRNPSLKLLVNVCGHALCESCVDLLFLKGSGSCPECHIPLRRNNFRLQIFEDAGVEKEVDIRKRVLREYNKKEEDFESLDEYNDYLEEIENIIFNLTNGIDVIETNRRIEEYKKENKDVILKNKLKVSRYEVELDKLLEEERETNSLRKQQLFREEVESKRKKIRSKEALIDQLMFSDANAESIVNNFSIEDETDLRSQQGDHQRVAMFSTGIRVGRPGEEYLALPKIVEGPLYEYRPFEIDMEGPTAPSPTELLAGQYLQHMRPETVDEKAGGYHSLIACSRALQQAVAGLYYTPLKHAPAS